MLEGIGLIKKDHKNKIKWVGGADSSEGLSEMSSLNQEQESLDKDERNLDHWIQQMTESLNSMTKDPMYAEYAYVTFEDIKSLKHLTDAENETILAVRAPSGTTLEVPEPESLPDTEREKYQLYLQSTSGEILVYMVSNDKQTAALEQEPSASIRLPSSTEQLGEFNSFEGGKRGEGPMDRFL